MTDEPVPEAAAPCVADVGVGGPGVAEPILADRWLAVQRTSLWLLLSAAGAIAVAWVAIQAQNHGFAPIGLTAIAIGAAVAEISDRAAKWTSAGGLRTRLVVALVAALLVVIAQDYIGFWEHVHERNRFQSANPKAAIFAAEDDGAGPTAFAAFLKIRLGRAPLLWGVDAVLTIAGAVAWTVFRSRAAAPRLDLK